MQKWSISNTKDWCIPIKTMMYSRLEKILLGNPSTNSLE